MSSIKTLIDAYIKRNANQEITGPVLNGVLTAIADALGTPFIGEDGYWYEYDQETGEYVSSGTPAQGESGVNDAWAAVGVSPDPQPLPSVDVNYNPTLRQLGFTFYDIQGPKGDQGTPGITGASVSVDANVGTPSVDASIVNSILTLAFHNLRGAAAGFGTPTISVGANQGTPSASVTTSGPDTAKVFHFAFDGLKGETGPQGPQGPQGNPGSNQDYPFTLANNLTTDDSTVALTAAMGVQLEGEVSQLESKVNEKDLNVVGVGDFIFTIKPYGHSANDDKINTDIKAGSTITGEITIGGGAVVTAGSQWQVYYFYSDNTNSHRSYNLPSTAFSETVTKDVIAIGFYIAGVTAAGTCSVHIEQSNPALYRARLATIEANVSTLQSAQTENAAHFGTLDKEVGLYKYSFVGTGYGHSSLLDQFPIDYKANTVLKGILRKGTGDGGGSTLQVYLFAADGETWVGRANISFGVEFSLSIASDAKYVGFYISPISTPGTFDVELSYNRLSYEIKDLDTRVDSLENGALPVPSYFAENIEDAVLSARDDMSVVGIDGDNLVFITDIHWENNSKNSPSIIRTICGELNIDNVVFGGDAINGQASQETAMEMFATIAGQLLEAKSRNFVAVIGNHDFNGADGGTAFDDGPSVFYSIFNKNMDYLAKHGGPTYYYFDNPTTQTRFIVLDTGASYTIPETQANWLTQVLNDTDVSLRVVIFMHTFLRERSKYQDDTFIGYDYEVASSGSTVEGIVDTAKANGKNIQCVIAGHAHIDYNIQTNGRIPVIGTDCDGRQSLQWPTTAGTINEQAFDIITIDYVNKTIKCRRIGRGKSRIIHYVETEMLVGGTLDISSDIEIVPTSYSVRDNLDIKYRNAAGGGPSLTYGGSIASISNAGVVTAISSGLLTAVAENDECIETFNIKIS